MGNNGAMQLNHVPCDTHWHGHIIQLSYVVCSYLFANLGAKCIKMSHSKPIEFYMNLHDTLWYSLSNIHMFKQQGTTWISVSIYEYELDLWDAFVQMGYENLRAQ